MIIGIDPGIGGGIAYEVNNTIYAEKMPSTPKDILEFIRNLTQKTDSLFDIMCYIEKVGGYMPGNSGPAAVKFARHVGNLEMALIALSIPHQEVLPTKWQKYLIGAPNYPKIPKEVPAKERKRILAKRKTERKNRIKRNIQARCPHLKVTLATADALGILFYGI